MNNLIIGNTSQLSHYFPKEYERVNSRNIPSYIFTKEYDRVFITFAEQRLHELITPEDYYEINVKLTVELAKCFKGRANKVVVYGSCELWNAYEGAIDLNDSFHYRRDNRYWGYCASKEYMVKRLKDEGLDNIIVIHPFNFNSVYRKPGFLFAKIFDSIMNRKRIIIGDTYFYRDLIHPSYVVERSILAEKDEIVGSGRLTHVNDFIRDLYRSELLDYSEFIEEVETDLEKKSPLYLKSKEAKYSYEKLLKDTLYDIRMAHTAR